MVTRPDQKIIVAAGQTVGGGRWSLHWPLHLWLTLTEAERAAVIARQAALLAADQPSFCPCVGEE